MKMLTASIAVLLVLTFVSGAFAEDSQEQTQQDKQDQVLMAVQQICPVTGNKLGTHGTPVKVTVGEQKEKIFLCCKGCLKGKLDAKHWATIHANFRKAQGKCPVMKNPINEKSKWVVVDGRVIYVCCPPCIDKIKAEPEKYIKQVDEYYAESLEEEKEE